MRCRQSNRKRYPLRKCDSASKSNFYQFSISQPGLLEEPCQHRRLDARIAVSPYSRK